MNLHESVKFIKSCVVHFDIHGPSNSTDMVGVVGIGGIVWHAYFQIEIKKLKYTQGYLAPNRSCSLIKLHATDKSMWFPTNIHTVMLRWYSNAFNQLLATPKLL